MTQNEFNLLCNDQLIDPGIALENDEIVSALRSKDDDLVKELLITQF
jgi:serine/threonine protein phosphatase PrpC